MVWRYTPTGFLPVFSAQPDGLHPTSRLSWPRTPVSVPLRRETAMSDSSGRVARSGNNLLDLLADEERARLTSRMRQQELRPHDVLVETGDRPRHVYFPQTGMISLMTPLMKGLEIETATVGNEGMVGVSMFLGGGALGNLKAMGQIQGKMLVMDVDAFRAESDSGGGKLRSVMLAYTQALLSQISQGVACNAGHEIRQRAARWLLQTQDRAQADSFGLTQEFLADMLGVTRPSVSAAAHGLQAEGMIRYTRGSITVLDRGALERASCECYQAIRDEYKRLLGAASNEA
jgi:CRP-like cAMP-binding protein